MAAFKPPNLAARGVRTLQVSPALHDLPVGDPPNYNSREFQPLLRYRIGARPTVAHHDFVVLGAASKQRLEFYGIVIWRIANANRQIVERWAYLESPHSARG